MLNDQNTNSKTAADKRMGIVLSIYYLNLLLMRY